MWSIGVGGNLPVDSAVFLGRWSLPNFIREHEIHVVVEFVPASHQYLLTVLSIWWAVGQLVGSLVSGCRAEIPLCRICY